MYSVKKEPVDITFEGGQLMKTEKGKDFSDGAENVDMQNEYLICC